MASSHALFNFHRFRLLQKSKSFGFIRRTLLTEAYSCRNAWNSHRQSPALKDLDLYEYLAELQRQVQRGQTISAIDIDVALTCVINSEQLEEAVPILYKFRHGAKAADMLPSTHSAFVLSCLNHGKDETLIRVLDDPINYGVFPDSHDANILMDHFLKNGNHRDAAKVASKVMLQEDFQRKSTRWLVALSCLKWIKEPIPDASASSESESGAADEDDEIIMRIPFLKNHYFDDHFDITELPALFGKTLAWISRHLDNKELSYNLMALGYGVKKDYKNLASVLQQQLKNRTKFYKEVENYLLQSTGSKSDGTESGETGEKSPDEPAQTDSEADLVEIKTLIDQLHQADLVIQDDLEETLLEELGKVLPKLEKDDIKERTELMEKWQEGRQKRIENQVLRYLKAERLKEITQTRQEMKEMEEYLNFFQNRTKLEISVHPELVKLEEEAKKKAEAEEKQLPSDDKYVVPELRVEKKEEKIEF